MIEAGKPHPLRIFIVENHPDTLKWLRLYLEDRGHTVATARTLAEAVNAFPSSQCEVLSSDIGLPDGDGWQLMDRVRPGDGVFAIAMSGFGMNADSERSRAAGFRHHLLKPFKPAELDPLLEKAAEELTGKSEGARG